MKQQRTSAKIRAEIQFGEIPFTLDGFQTKRITTLNAREEKRLKEVKKHLDRQRTAEKKRFVKAQKDTINHLFKSVFSSRKIYSAGTVDAHEQYKMVHGWATSRELLCSISRNFDPQWLIPEKNSYNNKRKYSQKVGIDCNNISSVSYSGLSRVRRILATERNLSPQSRIGSSRETPFEYFLGAKVSDQVTSRQSTSPVTTTKKDSHGKKSTYVMESEDIASERSSSKVLPPASLPPLHLLKEKTLKEKHRMSLRMKNKIGNDELWSGLEQCRYIRSYVKK